MQDKYRYIGWFVDRRELMRLAPGREKRLQRIIRAPHVTYRYRPDSVDLTLFGRSITLEAVGYGNNGENEGLQVRLVSADPQMQAMFAEIGRPHITLSVSRQGEPVNTAYLTFEPIEPFTITGTFGGYDARTHRYDTQ